LVPEIKPAITKPRLEAHAAAEGATMNVRYRVALDTSERVQLVSMVLGGTAAVRKLKRAQILLAVDAGSTDEEIARNVSVGTSTVYRVKQRLVEHGLERALKHLGLERNESSLSLTSPC
jgi:hypothetical protein